MNTYNIQDVGKLSDQASELATENQKIAEHASSISTVIGLVKSNWQNEAGQDLESVITELEKCVNTITGTINPTINTYVSTMNTLVAETRSTQSKTVQN